MPSNFTLRPGVFFNWIDKGISPMAISTSIGAVAFQSDRGPLSPTPFNDFEQFRGLYGIGDHRRGYGHDTVKGFFRVAEACYGSRVPGSGALYGVAQVANDYVVVPVSVTYPTGLRRDNTTITRLQGSDIDYTAINYDSQDIIFSGDMVTGTTFAVTVNGTTVTTAFTVDSTNTMRLIAQGIQTALDSVQSGGTVAVIKRSGYDPLNPSAVQSRIIRVIGPQNLDVQLTLPTFTGAGAPTATIIDTEWLLYAVSENPGAWASNIGIQFDSLNTGKNMVTRLLFGGVCDPLHSVAYSINGVVQTIPANAGGSNALLADVVASINANVPNITASVTPVSGVNNNREILLTAGDPTTTISVASFVVDQNAAVATAPLVSLKVITSSYVPEDDFSMAIYEYPNLRTPRKTYRATFQQTIDATGAQTNLEYQVNSGANRSSDIRIYTNPLAVANNWKVQRETRLDYLDGSGFLGGGLNGLLPSSAEMIEGWNKFEDTTQYTIRILMNAGYTTQEVHSCMIALCEKRRDCIAILDMASANQTSQQSAIQSRYDANIDSSYGMLVTPDIEIYDTDLRVRRYSPPSGYIGACFALTDRTRKEWWSPAGLNRGHIPEARGLRYYYKDGDISAFAGAQINPIINYKGQRIVLWNDYTLQYKKSPLQFVGTRRMCNTIEIIASNTVAYSLFEPNTRATRREVIRESELILQEIKDGQGIARFSVVDLTKPYHIDNRQAYFRYIIEPITSIHQIIIDGYLTRASADFSEYITESVQGNGYGA